VTRGTTPVEAGDHRRSFVRTTVVASVATVVLAFALGTTVYAIARGSGAGLVPGWLARAVLVLVAAGLLTVCMAAGLVSAGGVAVLHRDGCEERGSPYRPVRPRERVAGTAWATVRRSIAPWAKPRPGDLVEVRALSEILATLDDRGCLDGLPFMPEMVPYCGHQFPVFRRVGKVWEYAHGTGLRRMRDAVLLKDLRCDGQSHGGCQSGCQLIWKTDWLRWPGEERPDVTEGPGGPDLGAHTHVTVPEGVRYVCQTTQLREASEPLGFYSLGHYWRDLVSGNIRAGTILVEVGVTLFNVVQSRLSLPRWPVVRPLDSATSPHQDLDLQPGQMVRVRSKREIESTLNRDLRNRGLLFSGDLLADCGGTYRVAARIDRVINESNGELLTLKNPSILLEGVHAIGGPLLIPQNEYYFWREIWLEPERPRD
jgi:hypothetical protein